MERELGKDLEQGKKRVAFLMDNCDAVEEKGYMKPFTPEELARMKESLSETDIEINDIEEEKTAAMKDFKARLEPLTTERKKTLDGLKKKAEFVTERCFKFIDQEAREVGYYNENGDLIESRPAYSEELQTTLFQIGRKTGIYDLSRFNLIVAVPLFPHRQSEVFGFHNHRAINAMFSVCPVNVAIGAACTEFVATMPGIPKGHFRKILSFKGLCLSLPAISRPRLLSG